MAMIESPSFLYYFLAVVMLAISGYSLLLVANTGRRFQTLGLDVEISHIAMGLAMAGMFIHRWSFGPNLAWELIFAVLSIWFLYATFRSLVRFGVHLPHTAIHALMSFTMLLMYWYPAEQMGSMGARSMAQLTKGSHLDPGISLLLSVVLFASAIFTMASPNRGSSLFGTHHAQAFVTSVVERDDAQELEVVIESVRSLSAPWAADGAHIVMAMAMGFMVLLMV
jgi:hypothetical protein